MKRYRLFLSGCVMALAGACVAQQSQPVSLADLVKHSSKPVKKKDVVEFSDANLQRSAPTDDDQAGSTDMADSSTSSDRTQSGVADAAPKKAKKAAGPATKEDQRTVELKKQLVAYQKEEQAWKDSIKNYQDLIANEPSDFRRQMYQDSLNNDQKNAALFQQKINEVQSQLNKPQQQGSATTSDSGNGTTQGSGGSRP